MNSDQVLFKLLCYGLFPERLDGIFNSKEFGRWVISNRQMLNISKKITYSLLSYKITRNNNSPRHMGIPYPLAYILLSENIYTNWGKIEPKFDNFSQGKSMIIPKLNNRNNRLISMQSYDQNPQKEQQQLSLQFGKKYLVHADISTCFPSIYTHSISWALVGKKTAKQNQRKDRCWYNKLDRSCRNIQDGETRGIPIGPDTSGVLSEVILAQIDKKLKKYSYVRFIDDYKCFCATKEEADSFIRDLSREIEEYKLKLNTKKTKILPLPKALNEDWVRKLRQAVEWKEVNSFNKNKVISLLDLSSELFIENPSDSPIRYAAKVLKKKKYENYEIYKLIFSYFLNLCFLYPYIIDICDDLIRIGITSFPTKQTEIKLTLQKSLQGLLNEHTKYHRSDIITWCLFLGIKYQIKFEKLDKICMEVLKTKDCIPSLMCYLYRKINKEDVTPYIEMLDKVNESEWWIFTYEVSRIEGRKMHSEMEKLRKNGITFLNSDISLKI